MIISDQEQQLCRLLRDLPKAYNNRYGDEPSHALQKLLFRSLVHDNNHYLAVLFNNQIPKDGKAWGLREAQGATDGAEYTEAARGKPCGHIFKSGEVTYRCKTCTLDDTCVLCSRCFEASDHLDHMVYVSISPGNSGCCDCGDEEAWRLPVNCAIHTSDKSNAPGKRKELDSLPTDLIESIKMTIGRAIDYMCDVISCSPEQLRLHKTEDTIRQDEIKSRLTSRWYGNGDVVEKEPEYALILWNDEKHTVHEVENQVARACKAPKSFGLSKATETDDIGRSVITYSRNPQDLLKIASVIENIKITVTIRSARDTFREQMCSTIINWLVDLSGCSVGQDHNILKQTICKEMLKTWRTGSEAFNAFVGKAGLDDHERDEPSDIREMVISRTANQNAVAMALMDQNDDDESELDNENSNGDDEESQNMDGDQEDLMELDLDLMSSDPDPDGDLEMRTAGEPEDNLEVSEATYAGYPPPPPPPPPPLQTIGAIRHGRTTSGSDSGETLRSARTVSRANVEVPKTPSSYVKKTRARPPWYWLEQPGPKPTNPPIAEDIRQRVRLDWMILFDLRLWKKARVDLRDLYISTVVTVPEFKRILGLRFAGLYTVLAQLYLIADREPDHSIIFLSLQMLTTPSITKEIVEKGNFLTNLIAILYTFLTTRQVGHPWEVSTSATLAFDAGSVTNRRMYHFFMDLKHLFAAECVQEKLRNDERYVLQFLDLIRLPQGICPNTRAVGEHVEYETDAWISASLLTREINRLCRQFTEAFKWRRGEDSTSISQVIRSIAKATIINSVGADRVRFDQAEIKKETRFKMLNGLNFGVESKHGKKHEQYEVVDFVVEKEAISFHHALHYTLSWLIDGAKSMGPEQLRTLLNFQHKDLRDTLSANNRAPVPDLQPESYLVALFDYPLRVCAWLAQMKAGMWVRNGLSLRHQMSTYRGVTQRDLAHHRDIFMLQTAMVTCEPSRIIASMIDRFGMEDWMNGNYIVRKGFEDSQLLDVAEDFIHLMIVLLSDRTSLQPFEDEPNPQALAIRRDITHILCFKPLSFSDLCSRLADKFQDLEEFQDILEEMTNFRAPEGLSDSGTFELKPEFLVEIDPYIIHYTKNQRDEAETAYRLWMSKKIGKPASEVVYEPKLRAIKSGLFADLSAFSRTTIFTQIIYYSLNYALNAKTYAPNLPHTRVEAFIQVVLHLVLVAVLEDRTDDDDSAEDSPQSFIRHCLFKSTGPDLQPLSSVFRVLQRLSQMDEYQACHPKIRLIFIRIRQKRPQSYAAVTAALGLPIDRIGTDSPMAISIEDLENKKRQALDRQAKVMAQFQLQQQAFLKNQEPFDWGVEEEEDDDVASVVTGNTEEHKQMWKYPSGNCILCQEETNDTRLYGTFALMMNSSILRQTDLEDPDFIGEVIITPPNLDRSADDIRPFGIGGQNRGSVRKLASDGHEVIAERQGLGKGFPPSQCLQGPVSTGCGHIMHYSCFELYYAATLRRHNHQIARNHPERLDYKEFVCPLCKALGNTFLPIIWKGKEEIYPGVLQPDLYFDEWLQSKVGIAVSRFHKHAISEENKSIITRHLELFINYTAKSAIPPLANMLSHLMIMDQQSSSSPPPPTRARMPGLFPDDEPTSQNKVSPQESVAMEELVSVYNRVRDTISKNDLASRFSYTAKVPGSIEDLTYTDALARSLGFSISATEIAHRGLASEPDLTLLSRISPLTLTHLRILSETASSYIAVGALRNSGSNRTNLEFVDTHGRQLLQLLAGHPQIHGADDAPWTKTISPVPAVLAQDSFVFLAECSIYLVPALHFDIHHVIQLCYLLELVKVVLALYCKPGMPSSWPLTSIPDNKSRTNPDTLAAFNRFMSCIRHLGDPTGSSIDLSSSSPDITERLYSMVSTYALPFLRKVVILLHVRYGVDFPNTGFADMDESETDRLTKALRLPTLTEIFNSISQPHQGADMSIQQCLVSGWINHWRWMLETDPFKRTALTGIRPSHPAIFELIGLPKHYDTLIDEMMRRRCPTTGKDLTEPCICLLCGDIFCSQAICCIKDQLGGCNQHLKRYFLKLFLI